MNYVELYLIMGLAYSLTYFAFQGKEISARLRTNKARINNWEIGIGVVIAFGLITVFWIHHLSYKLIKKFRSKTS